MNDPRFRISTTFTKDGYYPSVLDFSVECKQAGDEHSLPLPGAPVGTLSGFIVDNGHLPDEPEDWYFDVFDSRSGHAAEAFEILVEQRALIGKVLPGSQLLDTGSGVALLERAWVDPPHRGKGLTLRLMREALHVFGRYGLLVMLKAHPDGDNITSKQKLALAAYYASDTRLGLRHISKRKLPGWLVAHWGSPEASEGDKVFWLED